MKKFALLLSLALLTACGAGVDTKSTQGAQDSNPVAPGSSGTMTVKILEPKQTAKFYNYSYSSSALVERRRIVVTNPYLDKSSSQPFKLYLDYPKSSPPPLTFDLPYASGYKIELLDYISTNRGVSGFKTYSSTSASKPASQTDPRNVLYRNYSAISYTAVPQNNIVNYAYVDKIKIGASAVNIVLAPKTVPVPVLKLPTVGLKFNSYSGVPGKSESSSFIAGVTFANISANALFTRNTDITIKQRDYNNPATEQIYESRTDTGLINYFTSPIVWANNETQLSAVAYLYVNSSLLLPNEPSSKFNKLTTAPWTPVVVRVKTTTF